MRIQLFNPPTHHFAGTRYRMNPALGLPILAAVLEGKGHTAEVMDLEALGVSPAQLGAAYASQPDRWPDAVGFTCLSTQVRGVKDSIAALRGVGYTGRIVVGGPHLSIPDAGWWKAPLEWGADAAVQGECEGNVAEVFAGTQHVYIGAPMPIEAIPAPLWTKHRPLPGGYAGNLPKIGNPEGISMWSRGCPHGCIFCGNPVFGRQAVRRRPPEAIRDELAALQRFGVRSVFVYDDELPGMPGGDTWLMEVCEAIRPLGLTWKCQGRCSERTPPEVYEAMHAAGCRAIMWGVESFSERVLRAMHKGTNERDITASLERAHAAGIGNWLFLMVGNYQETPADLAHTEARLRALNGAGLVQWRQVTVCTPVRGTPLYEYAKAEGWLREAPDTGAQMRQVYAPTPWLTEREIAGWVARLEAA